MAPCNRFGRFTVIAVALALVMNSLGFGQVTPEEHQRHHPGQGQGAATAIPPAGPQAGMMGGMGEAMHGTGDNQPRELYPSLMNLPELTAEKREEIQNQANERMRSGIGLWSAGLERLAEATANEDHAAMQQALAQIREGTEQFASGLAAKQALAEGPAPRSVALQWFKQEMNLLPPTADQSGFRLWGMSLFHSAVMAGLVLFAVAMLGMYYLKMQRAAALLRGLTGTSLPLSGGMASATQPVVVPEPHVAEPTGTRAPLPGTPRKWSGKLRVSQIFQETPDVKTFRLMNPLGGTLPFNYLPGQFLTVAVPIDGKPVKRSYTIASSPTQQDYAEITVKHEEAGAVSGFLHNHVQIGELLDFSGPGGSFIFTGRECNCILLIGGGVGITPLMSVLRYLTDRSWPGDIYLLYGCRLPQDIIFREELEYLERRHPNLHVVITVSRLDETDWKGPKGRITKELIAQSVPDLAARYVHICGPVPMMEALKRILAELGVPGARIKTEAFGPALGKPEPTLQTAAQVAVALPTVSFSESGKSAPLPPEKSILDVADEIGVEIDNSCRVGTCGTCRVKLLAGQVTMAVEEGLEPGDKEQGIILACQAKSPDNVTVEA